MIEIRFHGRGGQGALTAARILASGFEKEGKRVLVIPEFKSERRSAPVAIFLRIDDNEIKLRSKIYAPDYLVILDASLIDQPGVNILSGFQKDKGLIVINALGNSPHLAALTGLQIGIADVNSIARNRKLGAHSLPAVGTAMLGAFAKATGLVKLESIIKAAEESNELPQKENNVLAIKEAYETTIIVELAATENPMSNDSPAPNGESNRGAQRLPTSVISLGNTGNNKTGSWRTVRPFYQEKTPPCNHACPAGEKIREWLDLLRQGKAEEAWRKIMEDNPLPSIMGRVCPHPCEEKCNRGSFDEPLNIHCLEGFLGDEAIENNWGEIRRIEFPRPRIAVVGSGPAGLSCSYQLAKQGYDVTVFEALPFIGGMLRVGIPEHLLPKDLLNKAISLTKWGIYVLTNARIGNDIPFSMLRIGFKAIFIATGAHLNRKLGIPGEDDPLVISGLDFLRDINLGKKVDLGKKVIVIGGGNTAIDAARCARKMGSDVKIVYRKTRKEMRAFPDEVETSKNEGVKFMFESRPVEIKRVLSGLEVLFYDEGLGVYVRLECDNIITAIGQTPDFSFLPPDLQELIRQRKWRELEEKGIFIGGDAVSPSWVVNAIGSGKSAAQRMVQFIETGAVKKEDDKPTPDIVKPESINTDYFQKEKRMPTAPRSAASAAREAKRCFYCGACNLCGNCWLYCPHFSISENNNELKIDYDYCKGCGICANECPRNVISTELEE